MNSQEFTPDEDQITPHPRVTPEMAQAVLAFTDVEGSPERTLDCVSGVID